MKLKDLFDTELNLEINSLEDDSRVINNNYLYFAITGLTNDGNDYALQAAKNGAIAAVVSKDIEASIPTIKVADTNIAYVESLNKFYNNVTDDLKIIGVTGTDGKTSTTTIISGIINQINKEQDYCGIIGTNGIACPAFKKETKFTTPLPKELYSTFNSFKENKCKYVAMEVSSERMLTGRIDALKYDVTILTNVTKEHLNTHKTFENYLACKAKMFLNTKSDGLSIINIDDENAEYFIKQINNKIITYGTNNSDVAASNIEVNEASLEFDISGIFGNHHVISSITGRYNVYNLMAAIITCNHFGFKPTDIISAINNLEPIEGRNKQINLGQEYKVIIDYAHTPNALSNLLEYARSVTKNKLICVTGSAGGRDAGKRSIMGRIVSDMSDYCIFTTDDPRNEDPKEIAKELISDLNKNNYEIILDRKLAIRKAIEMAGKNDTVVIAGRGNDTNMPVKNDFIKINDIEEAEKYVKTKLENE